jgi:hypothetical protein
MPVHYRRRNDFKNTFQHFRSPFIEILRVYERIRKLSMVLQQNASNVFIIGRPLQSMSNDQFGQLTHYTLYKGILVTAPNNELR